MNRRADFRAIARQGFVDGVVDNLINEVMQTHFPGGTDIHGGAQAHRLQALQDFDTRRIVAAVLSVFVLLFFLVFLVFIVGVVVFSQFIHTFGNRPRDEAPAGMP
jgi:hypothetical protein